MDNKFQLFLHTLKEHFKYFQRVRTFPKKHPVQIVFGEPFHLDVSQSPENQAGNSEIYQKFLEELENRVAELGKELN